MASCAAAENPQRISTATDGGGSMQQQVFRKKNLSLKSVHGRTLFNRSLLAFSWLLASASSIFKSIGLKIYGSSVFSCLRE